MLKLNYVIALAGIFLLLGCDSGGDRLGVDVSDTRVAEVKIHRYDLDLFKVRPDHLREDLEALKPAYRFFLETDLGDPVKLTEMKLYLENPRNLDFQRAVSARFSDVTSLEKALTEAFRHFKFYFPSTEIPRVYAYISGGDYPYPVQFADSVMLIGLDNYLGKDFGPYAADGLPAYRLERMEPASIVPECMRVMASVTYPSGIPGNNLLEQMVAAGKRVYFTEAMIPGAPPHLVIGFTANQQAWIAKNEANVWASIIENRMLFSTDGQLIRTFMADGPFTPEFSKEAPPRLGEWLGWQIVRKYMNENPGVTLDQMMKQTDAQLILTKSKYKPEK